MPLTTKFPYKIAGYQNPLIAKSRIQSIDLLKGLVMIIMALDHVRHLGHRDFIAGLNPLDFANTTTSLFFTRWITNFCAPVFIFLSGVSVFIMGRRKTKKEISLFLLQRGIWLIILELTILAFGWESNLYYNRLNLQVIWVIGLCMVCFSALIFLPSKIQTAIGLILVFGHNLLDRFNDIGNSPTDFIWALLHVRHNFTIDQHHTIMLAYPLIPWIGVMLLGFRFGEIYKSDFPPKKRKSILLQLGIFSVLLYVLLRVGNFYGDTHPWAQQSNFIFTLCSFINTTKYPPSLLYLLTNLGFSFIFLAFAEGWKNKMVDAISIYGRVPLFFYILHIYFIHLSMWIIFFVSGHHWSEVVFAKRQSGYPDGFGLSLGGVYVLWIVVVCLLYLPCKWYDRYKTLHQYKWTSYI
jgi:uncharacterized membrane protein